jgi:hypothetical protein
MKILSPLVRTIQAGKESSEPLAYPIGKPIKSLSFLPSLPLVLLHLRERTVQPLEHTLFPQNF